MKRKSTNRGFTLIELIVVIGIIGILSSVVLINLQSSRHKGDDARRAQDMRAMRVALELYGEKNSYDYSNLFTSVPAGNHPLVDACDLFDGVAKELIALGYLPSVPLDPNDTPTGPACYHMWYTGDETYGTIIAGYAYMWEQYADVEANKKVGFIVSRVGDTLDVAAISCADNDFLYPVFDASNSGNYCDTSVASPDDVILGTESGN